MLDPRIYRTGFVAVGLAVIVFAFSLGDQQGALAPTLAPDAFNGQNAYTLMGALAQTYPDRRPGSTGDDALASDIAHRLKQIAGGYVVSTNLDKASTADGKRTLENIVAVRAGSAPGSIVVVSHRDSLAPGAASDLSGSATLVELAQVLAGETQHRTIVLASTSGSAGAAGVSKLIGEIPEPVDAVITLGDLAAAHPSQPVLVPWSDGRQLAPTMLRNTVAGTLAAQASLRPVGVTLAGQFAHLAFPFTLSEQGPFGARGIPAVEVSLAGDRAPAAETPVSQDRLTAVGRAVLQSVNALDNGPDIPRAVPYVLFQGKVIPEWSIQLLVLTLILPVFLATIDGLARARRRGHAISRSVVWVLATAVPFALALLVAVAVRLLGLIDAVPPAPVAGGAVPLHGSGVAVLVALVVVIVISFFAVRPFVLWLARAQRMAKVRTDAGECQGAAAATLLVACAAALALWAINPFAAALTIPALHLWMWVLDPEVRLHPAASAALLIGGLLAPALLAVYYAHALSLGPIDLAWNVVLLTAGGHVPLAVALDYCVLLGCLLSAVVIARQQLKAPKPEDLPVTVRGPITYAGPGSLGGTESAIRARR